MEPDEFGYLVYELYTNSESIMQLYGMEKEELELFVLNMQAQMHRSEVEFVLNQLICGKDTVSRRQFVLYAAQFRSLIYPVYEIYVSISCNSIFN